MKPKSKTTKKVSNKQCWVAKNMGNSSGLEIKKQNGKVSQSMRFGVKQEQF